MLILTETDTDTEKDQEWLVYDCMEVVILHREIDGVGYCRNFTCLSVSISVSVGVNAS